eukprot:TRINITY_DN6187_c0_g1_i7.p1 TRINITY_DN6187_c0_g1~~TRINITY_DN6187_c0_g1_i7.p1  ORF type:complete len:142 (-),score=26.19 TRINITY_DN6187_c0_g1_i7:358-783(-)
MLRGVFVTGKPGSGKTTLIGKLVEILKQELGENAVSGFITKEIRDTQNVRIGFDIVSLDGSQRFPLARSPSIPGQPTVGKYGVDVPSLERATTILLAPTLDTKLFVIDEIGKMVSQVSSTATDLFRNVSHLCLPGNFPSYL